MTLPTPGAVLATRLGARPDAAVTGAGEVVVLGAGGERYAVDLTAVDRIHTVEAVTALPGLRPPWRVSCRCGATSVVYGMPRQALLHGAAEAVLPVDGIAAALIARTATG